MNKAPYLSVLLAHFKIGDALTLFAAILGIIWLTLTLWQGGAASTVLIRSDGKLYREAPLARDQQIEVPGPLGISVVTIEKGRARISRDPSPRQYCVRQGWLTQSGEIAVCLPNKISVELVGGEKKYDSLNY